jgi:hypothetical protein
MRESRRERYEAAMNVVANAKNKLRKEEYWMSKQPKARSTKSRARIDQFYALKQTANDKPAGDNKAEFGSAMTRLGSKVTLTRSRSLPSPQHNKDWVGRASTNPQPPLYSQWRPGPNPPRRKQTQARSKIGY